MTTEGGIQTIADFTEEHQLRRVLGPVQLMMLGIGAIVGAGIFVITGHAAAEHAGPAVMLSFVAAGLACTFAAFCYAEFASMIPVAGSAYTYAYATLGGFVAWFIGWNLVLEYLVAASAVAVSWSGYFTDFIRDLGVNFPTALSSAPIKLMKVADCSGSLYNFMVEHNLVENNKAICSTGALINIPAIGIIILLTTLLVVGVRESATFNGFMVLIKVAIVMMVIFFGFSYINMDNLTPFIPPNPDEIGHFGEFGISGIFRAASLVFFAYIGFDAVSVAAQEAKNPQRDLPIGILGSLFFCTVLYILMSLVLTGIVDYHLLGSDKTDHPVSTAVSMIPGLAWLTPIVNVGASVGMATVIFVSLYGQSRIFYSMSRDGFLPALFRKIHPRFQTPHRGTILTGLFAALFAAFLPLDILGELVSIGTLAAFTVVCIGVLVLRVREPKAKRPFRTPAVWVIAPAGIISCILLMASLPGGTWVRLGVWTVVGLVIYFTYGVWHAKKPKWHLEQEA